MSGDVKKFWLTERISLRNFLDTSSAKLENRDFCNKLARFLRVAGEGGYQGYSVRKQVLLTLLQVNEHRNHLFDDYLESHPQPDFIEKSLSNYIASFDYFDSAVDTSLREILFADRDSSPPRKWWHRLTFSNREVA